MGQSDRLATQSYPDLSEPVKNSPNNSIKMGDHKILRSQPLRFMTSTLTVLVFSLTHVTALLQIEQSHSQATDCLQKPTRRIHSEPSHVI
jgi:hypothetical protein